MRKKKAKKINLFKNSYFRVALALLILVIILSAIGFGLFSFSKILFSRNPHFTISKISVKGTSYWNNRADKISRILNLKIGQTNLYELNLGKIKNKLEEMKEFGIESVGVSRELPDTLIINITERIPRATIYNRKSGLVVDQAGVLMSSKYTADINFNLPIITGFSLKKTDNKLPYGKIIKKIKPALIFISLINTDFINFKVKIINLYSQNELNVFMHAPNKKTVKVVFPFKYSVENPPSMQKMLANTKLLKTKLTELEELYKYLRWKRTPYKEINLLYRDQAIIK
ncbi:MAG TPA: FtsQ-type POTRA domain-containing protein [Victivallales bacterium]|nr:FtsQ-type POTRA domain-containing protein [Victivallales bacterium]